MGTQGPLRAHRSLSTYFVSSPGGGTEDSEANQMWPIVLEGFKSRSRTFLVSFSFRSEFTHFSYLEQIWPNGWLWLAGCVQARISPWGPRGTPLSLTAPLKKPQRPGTVRTTPNPGDIAFVCTGSRNKPTVWCPSRTPPGKLKKAVQWFLVMTLRRRWGMTWCL